MYSETQSNFLSADECKTLISLPKHWHKSVVVGAGVGTGYSSQRVSESCQVRYSDELGSILLPKLKQFNITSLPAVVNYARYEAGGIFKPHKDRMPGVDSIKDRLVTAVIQLNEGYEGGSLVIKGQQVEKGLGTIALFDSGITHNVTRITQGIRYSLTIWFTKDNLKPIMNVL